MLLSVGLVEKYIQWNPSIAAILGEQHFSHYIGVAFIEGLFCTNCSFGTWVPGRYIAVGLYSGVAVKRGSTVVQCLIYALLQSLTESIVRVRRLFSSSVGGGAIFQRVELLLQRRGGAVLAAALKGAVSGGWGCLTSRGPNVVCFVGQAIRHANFEWSDTGQN